MICQNRGAGGGARQTLLPSFGSDSPSHTRRAYNLPQKPIIIPLQWRWWVLGSRTCIHYKVTFGNQSCKEKGTLPLFETRIRTNLSTQRCILFCFVFCSIIDEFIEVAITYIFAILRRWFHQFLNLPKLFFYSNR